MKAKYKRWAGGSVIAVLFGSLIAVNIAVRVQTYGWFPMLAAFGIAMVLAAIIGGAVWMFISDDKL